MKTALIRSFAFAFLASAAAFAEVQTLTDQQGRTIKADVISVQDGKVSVKRDDGRTFDIPLSNLSEADQKRLKAWAAANPPKLGSDAIVLQFSRGKFDSQKESMNEGAVTAYKDFWGYSLTLANKSKQELADVRAEYILFVKQDGGPASSRDEKEPGMRKVKKTTKIDPIPLHGSVTVRTDTVASYRYVLSPGWSWAGAGGSSKPIKDSLYGMWLRIYVGDELILEKITPEDLAKTEKWRDPKREERD